MFEESLFLKKRFPAIDRRSLSLFRWSVVEEKDYSRHSIIASFLVKESAQSRFRWLVQNYVPVQRRSPQAFRTMRSSVGSRSWRPLRSPHKQQVSSSVVGSRAGRRYTDNNTVRNEESPSRWSYPRQGIHSFVLIAS